MSELGTSRVTPPAEGEVPLSFEAWADLSARMAKLSQDDRRDLLDEQHIEPDDWARCEEHYALALVEDIGHGRLDRAELYAGKCVAEVERRGSEGAASPAPGPEEERAAPVHPSEPVPVPEPAVPSFMQATHAAPHAPPVRGVLAELAATATALELPSALRPKPADALPFRESSEPSPAASPSEPKPVTPPPGAGETLDVPTNLMALMSTTLPFAKGPKEAEPVPVPTMSLLPYASYCAELAVFPERAAEIGRKYNLADEDARAAVDRDWRSRLDAHPATRAEWEKHFTAYREWLLRQPR
jgi:hypothetical protein